MNQYEIATLKNPLYTQNQARWQFLLESYVGGEMYRQGQHLNRYLKESDGEYEARLRVTPLDNQCASVISVYVSFLFREDPIRDFGSIANLPELADFLKDADLENRSLNHIMKEITTWSNVFGHVWVMVSKPDIGAQTKADELAAKVRPYVSIFTPLAVIDWNWARDITGRYTLDYFKYIEEVNGNIQTIKTWTTDSITTTIIDTGKKIVKSTETSANKLGKIPAFASMNELSIVRGIGTSSINDIADAQRFIYNATSEVDQSIRLNTHPSLVVCDQGTETGVGSGGIITVSADLPDAIKPYVLSFAVTGVPDIYKAIDATITSIEKMANIGTVRANDTKVMSGVAMETEFQLLNSKLSRMADNLELAEEQIWRWFCLYQGQPYDVLVEYPDSFNSRDTASEITQLKTASETTSDPVVQSAVSKRVLDWMGVEEDEMNEIQSKIDAETPELVTQTTEDNTISE